MKTVEHVAVPVYQYCRQVSWNNFYWIETAVDLEPEEQIKTTDQYTSVTQHIINTD